MCLCHIINMIITSDYFIYHGTANHASEILCQNGLTQEHSGECQNQILRASLAPKRRVVSRESTNRRYISGRLAQKSVLFQS